MNHEQMYQRFVMTNYFLFKYNLNYDDNPDEDFSELEIPN
jgi:hypothetical protein